ncbi:MAG: hypothetical protein JWN95_974 [Frankiales bacterium]|nr:hypothetical protein [Frankiales bacterium]
MRIRSKLISTAVVAVLSAVGFAASAAPASAAEGIYLYQHSYGGGDVLAVGTGGVWDRTPSQPDLSWVGMRNGTPANDQISSIYSWSPDWYCVYSDAYYSGTVGGIDPWSSYDTLWMNDTISSVQKC